ncbi:MAG: extracellular solute-binding protein [Anaerolineaceae bacterium]|nr:extracellular solute-binding protein [Anaerolineaceae bacterium]
MPRRPNLSNILLKSTTLALCLITACQPVFTLPPPSSNTTKTPSSSTASSKTTAEPAKTPVKTPTRPGHLLVDAAKLKGTVIQLWHPFGGTKEPIIDEMVVRFNQENEWGIHVESRGLGSSGMLFSQMQNALVKNELPNVLAAPIQQLQIWQEDKNIVIPLDDYFNDPEWGLSPTEAADIPRSFLQQDQINDHLLALPAQRTTQIILYNQTWAEELGFRTLPVSPQDFGKQACAAVKANLTDDIKENDGTGGWIINTDAESLLAWMVGFGLESPAEFGAKGYTFNNQQFRDGFEFFKELYDEGCIWSPRNPTPYDYFASRNTLFYSGTLEDSISQADTMRRFDNSDTWTILPYPGNGQKPTVLINGPSYAILVDSPEKQIASWLLIRWLVSPENQVALTESSGAWPASVTALESLTAYRQKHPQWANSLPWIPIAQPIPRSSSWVIVRNIFSDAAWQLFQTNTTPESTPAILRELDQTVQEVLKKSK